MGGKTWKKRDDGKCSALFVVRPKVPTGTDIDAQGVQDKVATFAGDLKTDVPAKMSGGRRRLNAGGSSVDVSASQSSEMCTGSECDNNAEFDSSVTAAPTDGGATSAPTDGGATSAPSEGGVTS